MKHRFPLFIVLILSITLFFAAGCGDGSSDTGTGAGDNSGDGLKLRFAALGDTQMGTDWLGMQATNPSSTNIPQFRQTIIDINSTSPESQIIFLTGDIVLNFAKDNGETLKGQLNAWQDVYANLPFTKKSQLLPLPGNHESDFEDVGVNAQAPNPGAINEWLTWFVLNGYDVYAGNGPTPSGANPDSLARDESKLTYSFNRNDIHFIVINTDTLTTKTDATTGLVLAGWIPVNWIEEDIRKAQLNPSISTIIAVGHRPIEMPAYTSEDAGIINTTEFPLASRLSLVMRENSKVKLYLVSHCHSWDATKLNNGAGVWQVIAGNGGAPVEQNWNPTGGVYYGYSIFDIFESGKIVVHNYGRDLPPSPQKFYEGTPVPPAPATLRGDLVIYSP